MSEPNQSPRDKSKSGLLVPRRAEEFRGVFEFLDKNGDGFLTKDELRYIMNGLGHDEITEEEIRDLIVDIGGFGATMIDEAHFLNFAAQQLSGDPGLELREAWKVTSGQTTDTLEGVPKETVHGAPNAVTYKDVQALFGKVGEDVPEEEAEEMVAQADRKGNGQLSFEEFIQILNVPPGGD
jgi:Ca2+-binding EF-hand superfamily protein